MRLRKRLRNPSSSYSTGTRGPFATPPTVGAKVLGCLVLAGGICSISGCGRGKDGALPVPNLGGVEAGEFDYDFVWEFSASDHWVEKNELNPSLFSTRRYLATGWSVPNATVDEDVKRGDRVWTWGKNATIRFVFREPADRVLSCGFSPFKVPNVESSHLQVRLNGAIVEENDLRLGAEAKLRLRLPKEAQVVGLNEVAFSFSTDGRPILSIDGSTDVRLLGAAATAFQIEIDDRAASKRSEQAHDMLPEGVRTPPDGPMVGKVIEQVSGALLDYYLRVPEGATFDAGALFARGEGAPGERAQFRVFVTPEGGERALLAEGTAAYRAPRIELTGALTEYSGRVCRLEFEVRSTEGPASPVLGYWVLPHLQVEPTEPPSSGPIPDLASVKENLRNAPIIVILLDATNPSFLTSYGGRAGLTPNLDRLATEGASFDRAFSQAAYTISSIPSTLTSRYTWEHGAWNESTPMIDSLPTWPERFRDAGYQTEAVFCSPNGSSLFGDERGFENYVELFKQLRDVKPLPQAEDVVPVVREFLETRDKARPFLLWLHIIEPHEPYMPPSPWSQLLTQPSYSGRLNGTADDLWDIRRWKVKPTQAELDHISLQYEQNLAYVDSQVGRIREQLEQEEVFQDAIVVVFADHGEGFLAHSNGVLAGMGHGSTVYDEMTRIPLIVKLPNGIAPAGVRPQTLVANFDLFPTLADLVGVEAIRGSHGVSFANALEDPTQTVRDFVISHSSSIHGKRFFPTFGLWQGQYKYVYTSGNSEELYDLEKDPGETTNLSCVDPVRLGFLRQELRRQSGIDPDTGFHTEGSGMEIDEETLSQLRALGYVR